MFANGLGDQGLIPGQVITKTQKMVLDSSLLNTQHYKVQIKRKWSNPGKRIVPSLKLHCSSYWKGNLWVTLNYGRPTYIFIMPIIINTKTLYQYLCPSLVTLYQIKLRLVDIFAIHQNLRCLDIEFWLAWTIKNLIFFSNQYQKTLSNGVVND